MNFYSIMHENFLKIFVNSKNRLIFAFEPRKQWKTSNLKIAIKLAT